MATKDTITVEDFADEILNDLPNLISFHRGGVTTKHLLAFYGESYIRIRAAVKFLASKDLVHLWKNNENVYYIVPYGYPIPQRICTLTELQALLAYKLCSLCETLGRETVQTSYSQLARWTGFSNGGVRLAIDVLCSCNYIDILSPSKVGKKSDLRLLIKQELKNDYKNLGAIIMKHSV